jgi:hypothetical protein
MHVMTPVMERSWCGHNGMGGGEKKIKKGVRKDYPSSSVPDLASSIASATSTLSSPSPNAVLRSG